MVVSALLFFLGLFLSAFFSGSETGFYRVTRVRLVMDAKSGNVVARCLLWMFAYPSLLVATVLIGNNLANYLVSLGLLFGSQIVFAGWGENVITLLPVLVTPFLFIYGELLPKYLYYYAPYRLSTRGAPLMVFFAIVFFPVSCVVMFFEFVLQRLAGKNNVRTRFSLERQELQRVMMEGQEAGILLPVQREMAQNLFTFGVRPVRHFATPLKAIALVSEKASAEEILEAARRHSHSVVGVSGNSGAELVGCYQVADLLLSHAVEVDQRAPLGIMAVGNVKATDSNAQVLSQLQREQCPIAQVRDNQGVVIGVVSQERLASLLLPV